MSNKKPSSKKAKTKSKAAKKETLEEALERLGIERYDLLLIGDGSGSNWNCQCGWSCVSIDSATLERRVWSGVMSRGTVNFAEMLAYLQPLNWYVAEEERRRKKHGKKRRVRHIHIITDSEYCKRQGASDDLSPKRNGALWRIFDDFVRKGFVLHWHWIPRETLELNEYADKLSKQARLLMKDHDIQQMVETGGKGQPLKTVYDYNPAS